MEDKNISESIEKLNKIVEELKNIENIEKGLQQKEDELTHKIENIKQLFSSTSKLDQMLDKINGIEEMAQKFDSAFDPMIKRIEMLSAKFGKQIDEAKQLETKIMLQKMDILIQKAEDLNTNKEKQQINKPQAKTPITAQASNKNS